VADLAALLVPAEAILEVAVQAAVAAVTVKNQLALLAFQRLLIP
jgi:hypothetical protein